MDNLYSYIKENSMKSPNKTIIHIDKRKIKNRDLINDIDNFSAYLAFELNLIKGDKVAYFAKNSYEFIVILFACSKIGVIFSPINYFLKESEVNYILNDLKPKLFIFDDKKLNSSILTNQELKTMFIGPLNDEEILKSDIIDDLNGSDIGDLVKNSLKINFNYNGKDVSVTNEVDEAIILYTSGTTGVPKGVVLTHSNYISNLTAIYERLMKGYKHSFICFLPMFHAFTLTCVVLLPLIYNSPITIVRSIYPFKNILKKILLKRITIFLGTPDIFKALAMAKLPLYFKLFNNIKICISGASSIDNKTFNNINKLFKKAKFIEGYGLSEASPVVSCNLLEKQKIGSVGLPLSNLEVKLLDDNQNEVKSGEIVVKGSSIMKGYYNSYDSGLVNGWLFTGDIGEFDSDGFLYIVDRKKDIIISKGLNIYPKEIELTIDRIDGVIGSAVVGEIKDDIEIVVAYVEVASNFDISASSIKAYLKNHIAIYKQPKKIYFKKLPRNAVGKILKKELKK